MTVKETGTGSRTERHEVVVSYYVPLLLHSLYHFKATGDLYRIAGTVILLIIISINLPLSAFNQQGSGERQDRSWIWEMKQARFEQASTTHELSTVPQH